MKALKVIILLVVIILVIVGAYFLFFNKTVETSNNNTQVKMTAEEITNKLKEKGLNIGEIVVYTEETDTNELLGRPNQYTSKTVFADTRITQPEKITLEDLKNDTTSTDAEKQKFLTSNNEPCGGTIEVFSNEEDMQKRKEYLNSMMSSGNAFLSSSYAYIYSSNYVLLRVHKSLTPTQAQEYETAFNEIMNNQ